MLFQCTQKTNYLNIKDKNDNDHHFIITQKKDDINHTLDVHHFKNPSNKIKKILNLIKDLPQQYKNQLEIPFLDLAKDLVDNKSFSHSDESDEEVDLIDGFSL